MFYYYGNLSLIYLLFYQNMQHFFCIPWVFIIAKHAVKDENNDRMAAELYKLCVMEAHAFCSTLPAFLNMTPRAGCLDPFFLENPSAWVYLD